MTSTMIQLEIAYADSLTMQIKPVIPLFNFVIRFALKHQKTYYNLNKGTYHG